MLRPLNKNVILKKKKAESTTASGIVLLKTQESPSNEAEVIAIGPECDNLLSVGCTVIFKEFTGTKFKNDDDEYIILDQDEILAIVE